MNTNPQENRPSASAGLKKIVIGITSVVVVVLIAIGFIWISQGGGTAELEGVIQNIDMNNQSFVLEQGKLIENEDGSLTSERRTRTVVWDDQTQFIPSNKNEVLQSLMSVTVAVALKDRDSETVTAKRIEVTGSAPEVQ